MDPAITETRRRVSSAPPKSVIITPRRYTIRGGWSHIWDGGYSAGYYSYLWSEVLDDDAYAWFKEHGGMTRANGQRFRDMRLNAFRRLSRTVWVVDHLLPGRRGLAHAVLVDASDPIRRKTVSTAALADQKFYVPVIDAD